MRHWISSGLILLLLATPSSAAIRTSPCGTAATNTISNHTTLPTSLVAYYKLGETSGTRADSFSTNTLTDNNTVTFTSGVQGNAAQFTSANSEYLSVADNAAVSLGSDTAYSLMAWVKLDSKTATPSVFVGKLAVSGASTTIEYRLYYDGTGTDSFRCDTGDGTDRGVAVATTFGSPSVNTWYLLACTHDPVADTVNISVNNGTVNSTAWSTGTQDTANPMVIGAGLAGTDQFVNGAVDEVYFAKKVVTATEIRDYYNSGLGLPYD